MLLLHTCCGPCLLGSYPQIESEIGPDSTVLFWYNPNIHPFIEYHNRLNSFKLAADSLGLPYVFGEDKAEYGLNRYLKTCMDMAGKCEPPADPFGERRCFWCYEMRFLAAARYADEHGFDEISTTLTVSPYQKHDWIKEAFADLTQRYGIKAKFRYFDLRPGYQNCRVKATELGIYRQKYCGCVFSEEERYKNKKKYLNPSETPGVVLSEYEPKTQSGGN